MGRNSKKTIKGEKIILYNIKSEKAEEFIEDLEIKKAIDFAEKNKTNKELIN